VEKLKTFKTL